MPSYAYAVHAWQALSLGFLTEALRLQGLYCAPREPLLAAPFPIEMPTKPTRTFGYSHAVR